MRAPVGRPGLCEGCRNPLPLVGPSLSTLPKPLKRLHRSQDMQHCFVTRFALFYDQLAIITKGVVRLVRFRNLIIIVRYGSDVICAGPN